MINDVAAERAVLAGICKYGSDAYLEITDFVKVDSFSVDSNQVIFKCLEHVLKDDNEVKKIDLPSIWSAASELKLSRVLEKKEEAQHLNSILLLDVEYNNVRKFAAKLRRMQVARMIEGQGEILKQKMRETDGTETIAQLLGIAEETIFDFAAIFDTESELKAKLVGQDVMEYVQYLQDNPVQQLGIRTGFDGYDESIGGGLNPGIAMIAARAKEGKAQNNNSIVYTPTGPKRMGDLKVGDKVCTPFGGYEYVTEIFEHPNKEMFEVTFNDDSKTQCCDEHLWKVRENRYIDRWKVLSLKEIMSKPILQSKRYRWCVQLADDGCQFEEKDHYIHPYILGCLIGDGGLTTSSVNLTNSDKELINKCNSLLENHYYFKEKSTHKDNYQLNTNREVNKIRIELERLHLMYCGSHTKFIPEEYKYDSIKNRLHLLNGLVDTDGSIMNKGGIEYSTVSERLAEDVKWLVQSLGGTCKSKERYTSYTGCNKKFKSYRLKIRFNDDSKACSIQKRLKLVKQRKKNPLNRKIVSIESVGKHDARCITITGNDKLYLTDEFIVTHNTTLAMNIAKNISKDQKIPVLYLDTEMVEKGRYKDVSNKLLACLSSVDVNRIKTGQFSKSTVERERVVEAAKVLESMPLYRIDISGKPFEDILSCMRRWVQGTVGLNPDGTAKDCVIIYDYLKVMNGEGINDSMQEYQLLGIMMTAIQNFALRYTLPVLAFAQMNRSGLSSGGADTVAGSDRISWFCTSLTAFQSKSEEEIAESGTEFGNKKMHTILSRYGPGHDFKEHVNIQMNKYTAQIYEVKNPVSRNGFEDKTIESTSKDIPDDQMEHYENGESQMEQQIEF